MTLSRLLARPMLASTFAVGALTALRNAEGTATKAASVTDRIVPLARRAGIPLPDDPKTLVRLNAGVQLVAAAGLATGRAPRLSAAALALSLVPTTAAGHRYWEVTEEPARTQQKLHFFKNLSMLGGLVIAAGDTDGKPGIAWRTRRVAKDARREAKHLAKSARQEAKLTRAKLT